MLLNKTKNLSVIVIFLVTCFKCSSPHVDSKYCYPGRLCIHRGVNISHWLSQVYGWSPRASFFTQKDVESIKSLGFDHIRLPIDECELWDENGRKKAEGFYYLTLALDWCQNAGLNVIVDLHTLRSYHFNYANEDRKNTLWSDNQEQDRLMMLWTDLQGYLKGYPVSFLAYEFLNEPSAPTSQEWNSLIAKYISTIRKSEKNRVLFVGANLWQAPNEIVNLELPAKDSNLVLTFHCYSPMLVTHHLASWTSYHSFSGPVRYPGLSAEWSDIKRFVDTANKTLMNEIINYNKYFDKTVFDSIVGGAAAAAQKKGYRIYCGEFGCLKTVDASTRRNYFSDFVGVLNKYAIAFAVWDYKGLFQIKGYSIDLKENVDYVDTMAVNIICR